MSEAFSIPEDIANRALQHCGAARIVSFSEDSRSASETSFVYDKLRRAELRRNVWRFATRRAVLYPINTPLAPMASPAAPATTADTLPTMLLVPNLWSATQVYDNGSIVVDAAGTLWTSTMDANVGQTPGGDDAEWDTYFGSMCVQPFNSGLINSIPSQPSSYYNGDLVYETDGSGDYQVYRSMVAGNVVDPSVATAWDPTIAYTRGSIVTDGSYFYLSNIDLNSANQPAVADYWASTATYRAAAIVIGTDGNLYTSNAGSNINHNPVTDSSHTYWTPTGYAAGMRPNYDPGITYAQGYVVGAADGYLYMSLVNGNLGNNPLTDSGANWTRTGKRQPWTTAFGSSTSSDQWLRLDAGLQNLNINYPLGSGPSIQMETRNVFMLPNGFLRQAPSDPKQGASSFLGAPGGAYYDDWNFEGDFIVSRTPFPIILRFVADVTQVSTMDDMFCEGFAARVGLEVCETLTQSNAKINTITAAYKHFMTEARTVNGIETGPIEPPEDDYITTRL